MHVTLQYLETLDEMETIASTPPQQPASITGAAHSSAASGNGSIPVASTSDSNERPTSLPETIVAQSSSSSKVQPLGYR